MKLVIVESPAKAQTIRGYLGDDYQVEASVGHVRDLPTPSALPKTMKNGPYSKFAVDVEGGFKPYYQVHTDKKKRVAELSKAIKDADLIKEYLDLLYDGDLTLEEIDDMIALATDIIENKQR